MPQACISSVLAWIDSTSTEELTAEATLTLGNGSLMSVRAGGPTKAELGAPGVPATYEVDLDHEPARFWNRYTSVGTIIYAYVPRLLVTHHVVRRGEVAHQELETMTLVRTSIISMSIALPTKEIAGMQEALFTVPGLSLLRMTDDPGKSCR